MKKLPKIKIILSSTREGRKGPSVAHWVLEAALRRDDFEVSLVDLAETDLPFLDEPEHPAKQRYTKRHTQLWSAEIDDADGFVIVTPEYNHGFPATLKNALDFVYREWNHKPVAFVSYGGMAGGTRAVQLLKPVVLALQMDPVPEAVHLPFFSRHITESGDFRPGDKADAALDRMLDAVARRVGETAPVQ
jgi:NAD(P)H-dependent FMN reductase